MATRASSRRFRRPPSPPVSDNDMPAGLQSFFALTSPPPTAPPSLPVSPPDSPVTRNTRPNESRVKSSGKRLKSERSSRGETATPSSSSSKQHGQLSPDDSPILPRVKLTFPPILSDDDDWSPLVGGGPEDGASWEAQAGAASGSGGRRTWSQTTTTTTRKTEHRSYRYSMPSFDQLYSDHDLAPPPKSTSAKSPSHAQPHLAPSSSSSSARNSSSSNINGGHTTRHSFSASKHSRTRSPSTASPSRKRTASPAARGFRSSLPSRRATSLHTTFGESPLQYSLSPRPCSPSDHPLEPAFFASDTLTTTTHNFFKPIMSLFAFLVISTVACFSISAVLLASFSLTFYDDCGRRVGDVQRSIGAGRRRFRGSIEGVKTGMERVVGGARGALELAVWAAGAKKPEVRAAPTMVVSDLEDDSEDEERDLSPAPLPSARAGSKASRTRSRTRRRRSTAGAATIGRRPNLDRNFNPTSDTPFDPSNADAAETASHAPSHANTWTDDEDAPPYDVPHTTPWGSRPPSPPPHRRSSLPSSSTGSPRPDALPPRPPLKILIPSVLFALLYTFVKVVWALWREERGAGPSWYERTRAASKARGRR